MCARHSLRAWAKHVTDPAPPITTVRTSVSAPVASAITKALGNIDRGIVWSSTASKGMTMRLSRSILTRSTVVAAAVLVGCSTGPETVVTGTLVGHDGQPMPLAHIHLYRAPFEWQFEKNDPALSVQVGQDGKFTVSTRETGALRLEFTGVNHAASSLTMVVDRSADLAVDVRLAAHEYVEELSEVEALVDFNGFSPDSALAMEPQSDGTYSLTVETEADTLAYQLWNVADGRSINGTLSESFAYDGGGDYYSIVRATDGRATITFDPAELVRSDAEEILEFTDPGSPAARFHGVMQEYQQNEAAAWEAWGESGQPYESFEYDVSDQVASITERLSEEEDTWVRRALQVSLLNLATWNGDIDSMLCRHALAEIPPSSPIWSVVAPYADLLVAQGLGWTKEFVGDSAALMEEYARYLEQSVAEHADSTVRVFMSAGLVAAASELDRPDALAEYYERLVMEYGDSTARLYAGGYAPDRTIQAGKPVPDFSLASFDDPSVTYTRESMLGKTYLLDFWATWCVPCVVEMGRLHAAYEEFSPRGLEVLSISFDEEADDLRRFREVRWEMPWLHSRAGRMSDEPLPQFEISGIPTMILVDPSGTIISGGVHLHGGNVREKLVSVFGEASQ